MQFVIVEETMNNWGIIGVYIIIVFWVIIINILGIVHLLNKNNVLENLKDAIDNLPEEKRSGKPTPPLKKEVPVNREYNEQLNAMSSWKIKKQQEYEYKALHDSMTGLLNKFALQENISQFTKDEISFIYCDVNNLKKVNDIMGHSFGDKLIMTVAGTLNEVFPDMSYRMGGDEFVVMLNGMSREIIEKKIRTLQRKLEEKTAEDPHGLSYITAVGFAMGHETESIEAIMELADKRMYENKQFLKGKE